jgi:hypothetical protein
VKLARFRKPKAACSLSYVKQRPNTNTSSIYTIYKACIQKWDWQRKLREKEKRKER